MKFHIDTIVDFFVPWFENNNLTVDQYMGAININLLGQWCWLISESFFPTDKDNKSLYSVKY